MRKFVFVLISVMIACTWFAGCSNNKEINGEASNTGISTLAENTGVKDTDTSNGNLQGLQHKDEFLKSKEGHDFQVVSWKFAKAYFSRDTRAMKLYLADPESKDHIYSKENIFNDIEFLILKLSPEDIKQDKVIAEYEFALNGKDTLQYLYLEMKRVNNEWKVQYYGLEQ